MTQAEIASQCEVEVDAVIPEEAAQGDFLGGEVDDLGARVYHGEHVPHPFTVVVLR